MAQIDINMWLRRFTRALNLQKEKDAERKQALQLYTGTFFGEVTKNDPENSEVNFVYEFVDVLLSAIYSRNPHIFVRASATLTPFAETMETVINYYWEEKKIKRKIKRAIKDAILQPPGWIEVGYKLIKEGNKALNDFERTFPELKDPRPRKTEEEQGILDETIKDDDVFVNHKSSWDVVWPDGYNDIRTAPYYFVIERTNLEDVMNNPQLKESKKELKRFIGPNMTVSKPGIFRMQDEPPALPVNTNLSIDPEEVKIKLIHVWDRRGQQIFTLAENFNKDTLFGPKRWNLLPEGFPYFPLVFNEVPQTDEKANSYPLSDIVPMLPQLKELSLISGAMLRHRKRMGTVILAQEGGFTSTQASNVQNAEDMDLVMVDNIDKVKALTPAPLPGTFFNLREVILADLMRISGMKQLLASGSGVETATESDNLREGARLRQSSKIDVIEDYTVDIARYLAGLIWQFKTRDQISEIIGEPVSEQMWPSLPTLENGEVDTREAKRIIQREMFFKIDAGSTQPPKDENVERKLFMDLAGILKQQFPGKLNDDVILPQILKKFDFKDLERAVITNDEEEIAVAQEENKLLQQGVPVPVSPNNNHLLHLQVHSQVEQNATLNATPSLDEHISKHAQFLEQDQSAVPGRTPTSDAKRRGTPTNSDLVGATKNIRGVGGEKGGRNV